MNTTTSNEITRITTELEDAHDRGDQMQVWQLLEALERATRRAGNT
jgi:hypothetical protein